MAERGHSPRFRAYIAASLDGYIADASGGVDWLKPFDAVDYGYDEFIQNIGLIVIGRTTFDQILGFGDWPYGDIPVLVLTHHPLPQVLPPAAQAIQGSPDAVAQWALGQRMPGDIWLLGGGKVLADFLRAGRMDVLELFVMPVLLGDGVPLFPETRMENFGNRLFPGPATTYKNGVVRLEYHMAAQPA